MAITYDGIQNLLPAKHLCLEQLQIQTTLIKINIAHYTHDETIFINFTGYKIQAIKIHNIYILVSRMNFNKMIFYNRHYILIHSTSQVYFKYSQILYNVITRLVLSVL